MRQWSNEGKGNDVGGGSDAPVGARGREGDPREKQNLEKSGAADYRELNVAIPVQWAPMG